MQKNSCVLRFLTLFLVTCIISAFICVIFYTNPVDSAYASEASVDNRKISQLNNHDFDNNSTNLIAHLDINEINNSIAIIRGFLDKNNTNVVTELTKQKKRYEKMLSNTENSDEQTKIEQLISTTCTLINNYELKNEAYDIDRNYTNNKEFDAARYESLKEFVGTTIGGLNFLNYSFASELLTHALYNDQYDSDYNPIHGKMVISSQITYDIANNPDVKGSAAYEKGMGTHNEEDLFYAIHGFDYTKSSPDSKVIMINDRYDFLKDSFEGDLGAIVNTLAEAEAMGVITPFYTKITFDASRYLRLKSLGKTSKNNVQIENPTSSNIEVIYNTQSCGVFNAQDWNNINNIETINVPAHGTASVFVNVDFKNGASLAFSYISGNRRIITYSTYTNSLAHTNPLSLNVSEIYYNYYTNIGIYGKNESTWYINIKNTFGERRKVEYNSKMCFEDDAKNWRGLSDINSFYLEPNESKTITISENVFATHIAVRLIGDINGTIIYANELNINCTMNVGRITFKSYKFLNVSIINKQGSTWYINITNPLNTSITVYYNSKMCNLGDAQNWIGLADISTITLSGGQAQSVTISENWFASSIAVSYIYDNQRIITYADNLNINKTMNVMNNVINA